MESPKGHNTPLSLSPPLHREDVTHRLDGNEPTNVSKLTLSAIKANVTSLLAPGRTIFITLAFHFPPTHKHKIGAFT